MTLVSAISVYAAQSPVNLGTAGNFVILTKSGISTTGITSIIGNIGVSPIAATAITGFGLILDSSNTFSTSSLVTGKIYAADYTSPTPTTMTTAVSDMQTAYTDAAKRTLPDHTELGAGNIGGMTLTAGLYKWGTDVIIPSDVILSGSSTDIWIFQIAKTLDISSGKHIILIGGAQAKNIFWQVAGQTTLGTTSVFNGNILDQTAIVLKTGATLNGRAFAQTAVTLNANTVSIVTTPSQTNQTNTTINQTSVNLSIAPWYPQGNNYVLVCNAQGFTPMSYDWTFGDGHQLLGYNQNNVYHSYANGIYNVTCVAKNQQISKTGILTIIANTNTILNQTNQTNTTGNTTQPPNTTGNQTNSTTANSTNGSLSIAPWYPQGMNYIFVCNPSFGATSYDWNFGDGQKLFDVSNKNVWHTYSAAGEYEVTCTATTGSRIETNILRIKAGTVQDIPPSGNTSVSLDIAPYFPQGLNGNEYVFNCNANSFIPTSYDWNFGDGQKLFDVSNKNVWHKYLPGSYSVECSATSGAITKIGETQINVKGTQEQPTQVLNASVSIAPYFPQGMNYIFLCGTNAFSASTYTWDFGDGQKLFDVSNNNVWHTYSTRGTYTVKCDAKDSTGTQLAKGVLTVTV